MSEPAKKLDEDAILVTPIMPRDCSLAEGEMQHWVAYVDPHCSKEHLEDPKFWTHVSRSLRAPAEITIFSRDMTWKATATCVESGPGYARVFVETYRKYFEADEPPMSEGDDGLLVEHVRGAHRWRVVRKSDGHIMSKGHASRAAAEEARVGHAEALRR